MVFGGGLKPPSGPPPPPPKPENELELNVEVKSDGEEDEYGPDSEDEEPAKPAAPKKVYPQLSEEEFGRLGVDFKTSYRVESRSIPYR